MRQFKLINSRGETFDLMNHDAYFRNPDGLGASHTITVIAAGRDFTEVDDDLNQQTIPGEMVFSSYAEYVTFSRFCMYAPLTFWYKPTTQWYYRECKLSKIDKGEIETGTSKLISPVDFMCFTVWRQSATAYPAEATGDGKRYDYTYPYTYIETAAGTIAITNDTDLPAPIKIHIFGPVTNPTWALVYDGDVYADGAVTATIPDGHKLVIDASSTSLEIAEYTTDNAFVRNLYAESDKSTTRFINAPVGESTLSFAHSGTETITAYAEVVKVAETV